MDGRSHRDAAAVWGYRAYAADPSLCRSARIAALADHWRAMDPEAAVPRRSALDPAEITALLPYVLLVDVERSPLRVRYRLVGTAIAEASRRDFTGLWLDEMSFEMTGEREAFEAGYRLLVSDRTPVYGRMVWMAASDLPVVYESAIFPLSHDGETVTQAIALEDHQRPIEEIVAQVPPRRVRRRE